MDEAERLRRAQRRRFIREHHPDRGGDPVEFRAGLRRFEAPAPAAAPARVVVVADQRWPVSAVSSALRSLRRRRRARVR